VKLIQEPFKETGAKTGRFENDFTALRNCVFSNHIYKGEPVKNQVSERGQKQGAKTHKDGKIRLKLKLK
jgi:hypothetical protein